jgi:hypothetical protein
LQREIPAEPAKGEANVIALMIRFSDGKKVARRFYYDDPIQVRIPIKFLGFPVFLLFFPHSSVVFKFIITNNPFSDAVVIVQVCGIASGNGEIRDRYHASEA